MRLLIITQKIDRDDPILGFFHRWLEEFAKHCEQVTVIALGTWEYDLPKNVRVFSLGKELRERSDLKNSGPRSVLEEQLQKVRYVLNFYRLIWCERKNYDIVFVHMNQEYVLLGGLFWKLLGKKIMMWRNHAKGGLATRAAVFLSDVVFCTSTQSFTARFKKTKIMPVGIDTDMFKRDETISRTPNSILFLGRISPVKNVDIFIDALNLLDERGIDFIAGVYGDSLEKDREYYVNIRKQSARLEQRGKITFHNGIPNTQAPMIYNQYEVFVNATGAGSFDKTILEAAACECLVVVSNQSLKDMSSEQLLFKEGSAVDLAGKLNVVLTLANFKKNELRKISLATAVRHDVSILVRTLLVAMK